MKWVALAGAVVALLMIWLLVANRSREQSFVVRAEVRSGDRTFQGSGARVLRMERRIQVSTETPSVVWKERGQATVVPLTGDQALFVLLDGSAHPTKTAVRLTGFHRQDSLLDAISDAKRAGRAGALTEFGSDNRSPPLPYPRVVYFTDPADPTTLRFVGSSGRFQIDGVDFVLSAIWIDDLPPAGQTDVIRRLPWLPMIDRGLIGRMADGSNVAGVERLRIYPSNFVSSSPRAR